MVFLLYILSFIYIFAVNKKADKVIAVVFALPLLKQF